MRFCPSCGARLERRRPEGDDRDRHVCPTCGAVHYQNPKIVVGSVCTFGERVLLCRRAIPPRSGFWTIPAGYLEQGETAEEGAMREAWEEARARIELDGLLAVYSVARIDQVQLLPGPPARRGGRTGPGKPGGGVAGLGPDPVGRPRLPHGPLDPEPGVDPARSARPPGHGRQSRPEPAGPDSRRRRPGELTGRAHLICAEAMLHSAIMAAPAIPRRRRRQTCPCVTRPAAR
jgi:8-oxo-dGTP pyrophosphatase MutT (NUDIX family)